MVLLCNCGCVVSPAIVSSMTGRMDCFDFFYMVQTGIQKLHQVGADRFDHMLALLHVFQPVPFFMAGVGSFKHFDGIFNGQFSKTRVLRKLRISWVKILSWRRSFIIVSRSLRMRLDKVRMMERSTWGSDAR